MLPRRVTLQKVKHIIILMQENHSFDNYFGALAYAPGSPYQPGIFGCLPEDHSCVDGLSCLVDAIGDPHCFNSSLDSSGHLVFAFHDPRRCTIPISITPGFLCTGKSISFTQTTRFSTLAGDGFVRVNQATEQLNNLDDTMGFFTQADIPLYYSLAQNFAIDDRYFSLVLGPTFPNRSYFMASFGHLGALVKEQSVTFAVVVVKRALLSISSEAQKVAAGFQPVFPGVPIILMAQDNRGVPTYYGRKNIATFLAKIPLKAIPWKTYTLN
jgi:phospholipase C